MTAVILVDLQADFTVCENGSLAVSGADAAYVDAVLTATRDLKAAGLPVFATQDWHPANHMSFATNHPGSAVYSSLELNGKAQVLWPAHCVQATPGARLLFDDGLADVVVQKGMNPLYDSYSGFRDDGGDKTELTASLRAIGVTTVVVYGLATDYCVQATALDAQKDGFRVVVIEELSKGVAPDTTAIALKNLKSSGILVLPKLDLLVLAAL